MTVSWQAVRRAALVAALVASTVSLAQKFDVHYPIREWLAWHYARCWAACVVFAAACLGAGHPIVRALGPRRPPTPTHWLLSFSTGVLVFGLTMFALGVAGLYNSVTFFVVPVVLFAPGAAPLWRHALRAWRAARDGAGGTARPPAWAYAAAGAGAVALALVYLPTLNPNNAAYDSRWYHLGLAEHYVAAHGIRPSPEGQLSAAIPHLASLLYSWAMLMPGVDYFDRVELAAHLEFVIFLATLAGIAPLVRKIVPGSRARFAWLWLFAFPSIFVYDSILSIAADHVAALWVLPAYLAFARAYATLRPRDCALMAAQMAGVFLAKYTASVSLIFPAIALVARALAVGLRPGRRDGAAGSESGAAGGGSPPLPGDWWRGPLTALGCGLALTAPHWAKNWLWYGDPLYPVLYKHLTLKPWTEDSAHLYSLFRITPFSPTPGAALPWRSALEAVYDHSFMPYTWVTFHGTYPVFGSLFTFSAVALPFVKRAARAWALFAAIALGIIGWYFLGHEERYLQALMPLMAAFVASVALLVWREGLAARAAFAGLVGLQLVWGGDSFALPSHAMNGTSPIEAALALLRSGYKKEYATRLRPFGAYSEVGEALPRKAKVLLHHTHTRAGLQREVVGDALPVTIGLSYGRLGSAAALYDQLTSWGVTHLVWTAADSDASDSVASDLVFWSLVHAAPPPERRGGLAFTPLPAARPPARGDDVLYLGCGSKTYGDGLYKLSDLLVLPPLPDRPPAYPPPRVAVGESPDATPEALAERATYAAVEGPCRSSFAPPGFVQIARRTTGLRLLLRP